MSDDPQRLLDWEDLGAHPAGAALFSSLRDLLARPSRFFDCMSCTGGLREPLGMAWLLATAAVLTAFPLALLMFALTSPDPQIEPAQYAACLLAPRATGFLALLLPVALCAVGLLLVAGGSVFHAGARPFGARGWEGSVSVWCYAHSAGGTAGVAAQLAACLIALAGWLVVLVWPGARPAVGHAAGWSTGVLLGLGLLCAMLLFVRALLAGCAHSLGLAGERALAAALAGLVLVIAAFFVAAWVCVAAGPLNTLIAAAILGAIVAAGLGLRRAGAARKSPKLGRE